MYASFNRFEIKLTLAQARACGHQGQCDADVAELLTQPGIRKQLEKIDPVKLKGELSEYGAWDDAELEDMEANYARILWIAANDIVEEAAEKGRKA